MQHLTPICYSQNSGNNYSRNQFHYQDQVTFQDTIMMMKNSIDFAQFSAAGTSSISTGAQPTKM